MHTAKSAFTTLFLVAAIGVNRLQPALCLAALSIPFGLVLSRTVLALTVNACTHGFIAFLDVYKPTDTTSFF